MQATYRRVTRVKLRSLLFLQQSAGHEAGPSASALLHSLPPVRVLGVHEAQHVAPREAEAGLTARDQFVADRTVGEQGPHVVRARSFAEAGGVVRRAQLEAHLPGDAGLGEGGEDNSMPKGKSLPPYRAESDRTRQLDFWETERFRKGRFENTCYWISSSCYREVGEKFSSRREPKK